MIVSPNPLQAPFVQSKLKEVTIRLKDSLRPNTTYSVNLGRNLKDVNEGNVYKNFTYVFSTGDYITTGKVTGKVQLAETGQTDSTLLVILQNNLNDTAIQKLRPLFYTRLDSAGNFAFNYLPSGDYAIYVVPDDYSKRYDDSTKVFAFYNSTLHVDSLNAPNVNLYAYQEIKPKPENKSASSPERNNDESKPKNRKKNGDDKDTIPHLQYKTDITGKQDLLSSLHFIFTDTLASFDSSKIILTDTNYKTAAPYHIAIDTFHTSVSLAYPWKETEYFKLVLLPGAFTDSSGVSNKQDTISFQTKAESEYGSIMIRFTNLDLNKNPVLQLIQNNQIKDSIPLNGTEFKRRLFTPGEYEVRILNDDNKNGKWDAGNFLQKRQPEIVERIPRRINIRSNWDNEINIEL